MVTHDPELAARAHRNVHVIDGQVTDFDAEPQLVRSGTQAGDTRAARQGLRA
jgi:putative ABC transport system ATP-binding protein